LGVVRLPVFYCALTGRVCFLRISLIPGRCPGLTYFAPTGRIVDFELRMSDCGFGIWGRFIGVFPNSRYWVSSRQNEIAGFAVEAFCPKGKQRVAPRSAWGMQGATIFIPRCLKGNWKMMSDFGCRISDLGLRILDSRFGYLILIVGSPVYYCALTGRVCFW